jgi:hypothetical protein
MIFEPSHIKQTIFNDYKTAGTSLNDMIYNQNKKVGGGNLEISKTYQRFDNLAVPTGLFIENNNEQIGGCNNIIKSSDVNVISDDMFQKLFDAVTIKTNSKTRKLKATIKKNKTKKSWFI